MLTAKKVADIVSGVAVSKVVAVEFGVNECGVNKFGVNEFGVNEFVALLLCYRVTSTQALCCQQGRYQQ